MSADAQEPMIGPRIYTLDEQRELIARVKRLEAVAEAARHLLRDNKPEDLAERADPLRYALRALDEEPT